MWGGKKTRDSRISSSSSSSVSTLNKDKSDYNIYDWEKELEWELRDVYGSDYHVYSVFVYHSGSTINARVRVECDDILSESIYMPNVKRDIEYAIRRTGCPYSVHYEIEQR